MYKAIITSKSDVDSGGFITVTFDVLKDDVVLYTGLQTTGKPDGIEDNIKVIISNLKLSVEQANLIQIGQEVSL